jgi:predicted homoserine dehydrogenase-like protein
MTDWRKRLQQLDHPIYVSIIGAGAMGKGLAWQCQITPGVHLAVLADLRLERAIACAEWLGRDFTIVESAAALHDAVAQGRLALCADGLLAAGCELVDALIEASSAVVAGAQHTLAALLLGKHAIMLNAEADLAFGPHLLETAHSAGAVYTSCDGDQHTVLARLVNDIQLWGFDLVMAGNIKGFLDRYSNPTKIIPEADKRNLDYVMATAYTDGSKLNIEMALFANAYGAACVQPGMLGPAIHHVDEVLAHYDFAALWQGGAPRVDYILGAEPGGGVFAVGYCADPYQQAMLNYYKRGTGPFYLFYRPYHLCHVEAIQCVAEAVLDGDALLQPTRGFQTDVYAYAKRALCAGERLDGLGGYACYGQIENCADRATSPGLPICLSNDATLLRQIAPDERIGWHDVRFAPDAPQLALYIQAQAASRRLSAHKTMEQGE